MTPSRRTAVVIGSVSGVVARTVTTAPLFAVGGTAVTLALAAGLYAWSLPRVWSVWWVDGDGARSPVDSPR